MFQTFIEIYCDKAIFTVYNKKTNIIISSSSKNFLDETGNVSFSIKQFEEYLKEFKKNNNHQINEYYLILSQTYQIDFYNFSYKDKNKSLEDVIKNELIIRTQNTSYDNKEIYYKAISLKNESENYHLLFLKKEIMDMFIKCFKNCNIKLKDVLFDSVCLHHLFDKYHSNCTLSDQKNSFMFMLDIKEYGSIFIGVYDKDYLIFPMKYGLNYYVSIGQLQFDTDVLEFFEIYLKNHSAEFNYLKILLTSNCENNGEILNYLKETKFPFSTMMYPTFDFTKLLNISNINEYKNINVVLGAIQYLNSPMYTINFMDNYNEQNIIQKIKNFIINVFKNKENKP